jgi:hypothetical protein
VLKLPTASIVPAIQARAAALARYRVFGKWEEIDGNMFSIAVNTKQSSIVEASSWFTFFLSDHWTEMVEANVDNWPLKHGYY